VPQDPDLIKGDVIKVVFASGPADLNRALIDRIAAAHPELPLYVVGEFQPEPGTFSEWIPYHVLRGFRENLAAVRAAIDKKWIRLAAMVLSPAVPSAKMRLIAYMVAAGALTVYDENLNAVHGARWGNVLLKRARTAAGSPRTRLWLRRLTHPGEAEIPVRARAARIYGIAARLFRPARSETSFGANEAFVDPIDLVEGIGIVIPSRNGRELLANMLPALLPQLGRGEIIVSDNGSTDGTAEWLAQRYPEVRVIRTAAPLSFARAVNLGTLASGFTRTLLLNNDMIVQPGFIEALRSSFDRVPDLFCATAQIFFPPGVRREETGKAVWRRDQPRDFPVRCDEPVPGEDLTWVLYGSGGCSLLDTAKLRALGGVSEAFDPAYVEDLDLGYRAWKRGWPSVFCAGAQVEHRHRGTTSRYYTAEQIDSFVERNYLRFLIHAVGSAALFRSLWLDAIRRLQLNAMGGSGAALNTLRNIPRIGPRPPQATGPLSETEILALGNGEVAVFPGLLMRSHDPQRRVVVVASPYLPFPLSHGGAVRIYNLMKHAAGDRDQVLIAFCDELATPPRELLDICREIVLVRRRGSHYRLNTPRPDVAEEFHSQAYRAALKQTVRKWRPGVIQLEFTQMAQYAGDCHPAKTILVEHDITFDLQQQLLATSAETGAARWEMEQQLQKWRDFETAAWKAVDCVVTMSKKDESTVAGAKRTICLPNGVDTERFQPSRTGPSPRHLLFVGSFAHLPNLLAFEFFLREVWPLLGSGFTLHVIAGARPGYFLQFHRNRVSIDVALPGIELEGFVPDVRSAYNRAEIVLAPLTASAGTNIKVLEAMAMGRVVVSTPAGVNGLDLAPDREVIVTGSASEMAARILAISADPVARKNIEANARQAAFRYDWREIAVSQSQLYAELSERPF
jgi:GT2 family glycosyltransferase/glycosyltransferase involved in cell wall biosynthesis